MRAEADCRERNTEESEEKAPDEPVRIVASGSKVTFMTVERQGSPHGSNAFALRPEVALNNLIQKTIVP